MIFRNELIFLQFEILCGLFGFADGTYCRHASPFTPLMFMPHEPQIPSLHDLLKVRELSCSILIFSKACKTIGPQLIKNIIILLIRLKKKKIEDLLIYIHNILLHVRFAAMLCLRVVTVDFKFFKVGWFLLDFFFLRFFRFSLSGIESDLKYILE